MVEIAERGDESLVVQKVDLQPNERLVLAVQNVADRTVVYLADPQSQGRFIEREVRLGELSGDQAVVVSGLQTNDRVVTVGSFALRAERERLGLRTAP